MTYTANDGTLGVGNLSDVDTTKRFPLGTIIYAADPTYGMGEFIYLQGIGSTVVGSLVTYNPSTHITALAPVGTNKPEPVAVAMGAIVASSYGWYQIGGVAIFKKTSALSFAAGVAVGCKTVGLIASTGTGKEIQGALTAGICSATVATGKVMLNRPHMQGRIT
jgi:hypothetical protein